LDKEKLLLGVWEEPSDPSTGFGGTMAKILLFTKLKKRRVEFFKDHTFYETNQREEKQLGGVYYSTKTGEITLMFTLMSDYHSDLDSTVKLTENELSIYCKGHSIRKYTKIKD